jgi:hypothetical protein
MVTISAEAVLIDSANVKDTANLFWFTLVVSLYPLDSTSWIQTPVLLRCISGGKFGEQSEERAKYKRDQVPTLDTSPFLLRSEIT